MVVCGFSVDDGAGVDVVIVVVFGVVVVAFVVVGNVGLMVLRLIWMVEVVLELSAFVVVVLVRLIALEFLKKFNGLYLLDFFEPGFLVGLGAGVVDVEEVVFVVGFVVLMIKESGVVLYSCDSAMHKQAMAMREVEINNFFFILNSILRLTSG